MWMSLQKQAELRNLWLKDRLTNVLPDIMRRDNMSMWIVSAREYNEDPVLMSMLPEPSMSARRRTVLAFAFDQEGKFRKMSLGRYPYSGYYEQMWDPSKESQADALQRVVNEMNPESIGLNMSALSGLADGLSHCEYDGIMSTLPQKFARRVRSAEKVAVGWIETRSLPELTAYPMLVDMGHQLIKELYSRDVIRPGITTTDDAVWWLRERMQQMGVRAWFQPTVEIQYPGSNLAPAPGMDKEAARKLILPGDLVHVDVGFGALGLMTDQQQHAYVLRQGETQAPAGLAKALREGNRLQEIVMEQMHLGRTGNQILKAVREQAFTEWIQPSVYSHPLGTHGHSAGTVIGMWDSQQSVPGLGDYPLHDSTAYSIELNVQVTVPEWDNQYVRIALEEDAALVGGKMAWMSGRQTRLHLI